MIPMIGTTSGKPTKETIMSTRNLSAETMVLATPQKYAIATPSNLLTPIKGEPPIGAGRGRRRNPIITKIYNELITNRNQWFHVNITLSTAKQVASFRASMYARAKKDNLEISTSAMFNDSTKTYDFWVILY